VLALSEINAWHWGGFVIAILLLLALDLGVFHRTARVVTIKEALFWTALWFVLAMGFASALVPVRGREEALEFVTGYVVELSLSMDNVFAIALIFAYFRIPALQQHRVLFWGIIGALVMRGIMIGVGAALIQQFHFVLYLFGAFLIYTSFKMAFAKNKGVRPEKNPLIRLARSFFPVSSELNGQSFTVAFDGRTALTPLALVMVMVETTDLIFAFDSIPAIFAVTQKPFIVFTSNVFAILGLRSLYFVLAGAIGYFRYLKAALSEVLVFIGLKMLVAHWYPISIGISLTVVGAIIALAIGSSIIAQRFGKRSEPNR
jgi:tellurite resistance protein TerC